MASGSGKESIKNRIQISFVFQHDFSMLPRPVHDSFSSDTKFLLPSVSTKCTTSKIFVQEFDRCEMYEQREPTKKRFGFTFIRNEFSSRLWF